MHHCRFCGGKIASDASTCSHCGKTLRSSDEEAKEAVRLTHIDSWQNKSIPSWVMYLVVAFFLACLALMIYKGYDKDQPASPERKKAEPNEQARLLFNQQEFGLVATRDGSAN